jgi:hypothetical protein
MEKEEYMEKLKDLLEAHNQGWKAGFKAGVEYALKKFTEDLGTFSKEINSIVASVLTKQGGEA